MMLSSPSRTRLAVRAKSTAEVEHAANVDRAGPPQLQFGMKTDLMFRSQIEAHVTLDDLLTKGGKALAFREIVSIE